MSFMEPAEFQRAEVDVPDAIGVADDYPLSVWRFVRPITRMQWTVVHASTLACPPAADPQHRETIPAHGLKQIKGAIEDEESR